MYLARISSVVSTCQPSGRAFPAFFSSAVHAVTSPSRVCGVTEAAGFAETVTCGWLLHVAATVSAVAAPAANAAAPIAHALLRVTVLPPVSLPVLTVP